MVLDPIPQSLPVHFFGSRPQTPTSPLDLCLSRLRSHYVSHTHAHTHAPARTHAHTHTRTHSQQPCLLCKEKKIGLLQNHYRALSYRETLQRHYRVSFPKRAKELYEIGLFKKNHYRAQSYRQTFQRHYERWGAGVETQKNVWGEIGGWGRVPFNETYAPSLSTIYDGA